LKILHRPLNYVIVRVGCERSESPQRLNGEDTELMYSKHLSVYSILTDNACTSARRPNHALSTVEWEKKHAFH